MEPTFTNDQIQACLTDVEEEIPRLTTSLVWSKLTNKWTIHDRQNHHLGWVSCSVCCDTGDVTLSYKPRSGYTDLEKVPDITVQVVVLPNEAELSLIQGFNDNIQRVHGVPAP